MTIVAQQLLAVFDIAKAEALRRKAGNPSYAAIAAAMGLKSRQAVGHWFRGRGEPDVRQMKLMAEALHCHWLELVTDETVVVYREDELRRVEQMRSLDAEGLAELDAYLAFKRSLKIGEAVS
ncbi:MAG: helix-turn-helix domain-containing protein [Rhodanobacteraceae bacterium]